MTLTTLRGGYDENLAYLIETGEAAVLIDAALLTEEIDAALAGRELAAILLTHPHGDHVMGLPGLLLRYPEARVVGHPGLDPATLDLAPDRYQPAAHGEQLALAGITLTALHTPGHHPLHLCYLWEGNLFSGDLVFTGRVGRVIHPGASGEVQYASIRDVVKPLPGATVLRPGHAYGEVPSITLAEALEHNPFLAATTLEAFLAEHEAYEDARRSP